MKRTRKSDIKVEFIEGREMTEAEFEAFVQILFQWWKRDFERKDDEGAGPSQRQAAQP